MAGKLQKLISAVTKTCTKFYFYYIHLVDWKLSVKGGGSVLVYCNGLKKKEDEHWDGRILTERARTAAVRVRKQTTPVI